MSTSRRSATPSTGWSPRSRITCPATGARRRWPSTSRTRSGGEPGVGVSHGDGLGGSSLQYGMSSTSVMELSERARRSASRARIAVLLLPGVGTRRDLAAAVEHGAQVVRIATHSTEADISEQHFAMGAELGLETIGFLMMSHMLEPDALAEQA